MNKEFHYPPVKQCIYCGATAYSAKRSKLGDEHVIPYSLNGGLVLPEASCQLCEKRTHAYEGYVAGTIFGDFRAKYAVQSRRPKQRPTHVTIGTVGADGVPGTKAVPIPEHPTPVVLYKFAESEALKPREPNERRFQWVPVIIASNVQLRALKEQHQWDGMLGFTAQPLHLARLLAKIAYSYAVAEVGLGNFRPHPTILKVILNKSDNVSKCVGGDLEIPTPDPAGYHILNIMCHVMLPEILLIVEVRLFPAFETPLYRVVVGSFDLANPDHAHVLESKLKDAMRIK